MGVKLSKIKRVCLQANQVRLYTVEAPSNMVLQWLGVDGALYPVEGVHLTMDMLAVIWELTAKKRDELEVQEMTLQTAVDTGLMKEADAEILRTAPALVDVSAMEYIGIARIFDHAALRLDEDRMVLVEDGRCRPCWYGSTRYEIVRGAGIRVLVYTDGQLSGVITPADSGSAAVAQKTIKALAALNCVGA